MVHFVGAGSGAEDLITIRGKKLLEEADIIIYAGSLVNPVLLGCAKEGVRIFNSAHMTLEQVAAVMCEHRTEEIVRLHTGDPSLFGAIREQMDVLDAERIPYDVTPGVSSFLAAAAALREEYTLPAVSQTVILTRMEGRTPVPEKEKLAELAKHGASMVIFLSASLTQEVQEALLQGAYVQDTPAAIVCRTGWPEEKLIRCTVGKLHEHALQEGIRKTALILVGDFLKQGAVPERSCLYDPGFSTGYRQSWRTEKTKLLSKGECMRKIRIACFSTRGETLGQKLGIGEVIRFPAGISLSEWTGAGFRESDALIFIASCGIAVRSIAPFVRSKQTDPAVLAVDETGTYVIPVLGGHTGGANALADRIAQRIGAHAVITTATDRRHTFAADSWAAENGFGIVNPEAVKKISAAVLDGDEIIIKVRKTAKDPAGQSNGTVKEDDFHTTGELRLLPRTIAIGAGCRKGTDPDYMESCLQDFCQKHDIEAASISCIASIDLKRDEPALKQLAGKRKIPFLTYSAEELMEVEGDFASSGFVLQTTGADNVCERAAVRAGLEMDGLLLSGKNGINDTGAELVKTDAGQDRRELFIHREVYQGVTLAASRMKTVRSWKWV